MNRRQFNQVYLATAISLGLPLKALSAPLQTAAKPLSQNNLTKIIPSSGKRIPAVGMGTWITFDHNPESRNLTAQLDVLKAFFAAGGGLIDSSPMYGYAQKALGALLPKIEDKNLFSATKVWVPNQSMGISQMNESIKLWNLPKSDGPVLDLMMVHNLVSWQAHLETLKQWKAEGKIKYIGVTTSHGRRHGELKKIMETQDIDFIQLTYNLAEREAEKELLPLALEKRIAVIINRPYQTGAIFQSVTGKPLPDLAKDLGCHSWAQYFLKFVISHPAVTCAIPATSQAMHMKENMLSMQDPQPDSLQRQKMSAAYNKLFGR